MSNVGTVWWLSRKRLKFWRWGSQIFRYWSYGWLCNYCTSHFMHIPHGSNIDISGKNLSIKYLRLGKILYFVRYFLKIVKSSTLYSSGQYISPGFWKFSCPEKTLSQILCKNYEFFHYNHKFWTDFRLQLHLY